MSHTPQDEESTTPQSTDSSASPAQETQEAPTANVRPQPEAQTPKIKAKVGGKEKEALKDEHKKRLDKELGNLRKKQHDLKNKHSESINSPEEAYKLFSIGTDIAEGLKLKYQIAKVENFQQRAQEANKTPEAKAKLQKDIDNYFYSPKDRRKDKYGAIGKQLGGYLGPVGSIIGEKAGKTIAPLASLASSAKNLIEDVGTSVSNTFNKVRGSGPINAEDNDASVKKGGPKRELSSHFDNPLFNLSELSSSSAESTQANSEDLRQKPAANTDTSGTEQSDTQGPQGPQGS